MLNDPNHIASQMTCPYCKGRVSFRSNDVIYGRRYGSGFAYICNNFPTCDSFVGCHGEKADERQRYKPLGTLANKPLRELRRQVHSVIDSYWQNKLLKRNEVYNLLADLLQVHKDDCHIGMFDEDQCRQVLDKWNDFLPDSLRNAFIKPNIRME